MPLTGVWPERVFIFLFFIFLLGRAKRAKAGWRRVSLTSAGTHHPQRTAARPTVLSPLVT